MAALPRARSGSWLAGALLLLAFGYFCVLPFIRPRGPYLWGHFALKDVYPAIPIALAAAGMLLVAVSPARFRRPLAIRLTALLVATLLGIFGFDAVYALLVGQREWKWRQWFVQSGIPRSYNIRDEELGYKRKPNLRWNDPAARAKNEGGLYRTDEQGFRNASGIRQADVVFLGDSFTEATDFAEPQTFVQRVGAAAGVPVVNLGVGGYGPPQQEIILRRYGMAYRPRFVVWQIYEGNDLKDATQFANWVQDPVGSRSLKDRYLFTSPLARLLEATRVTDGPTSAPVVAYLRASNGAKQPADGLYMRYLPDLPRRYPLGMAETCRALEAGYRLCESRGVRLLVVFIPIKVRVLAPHLTFTRPEVREAYLPDGKADSQDDFGSELARHCRQLGCPFVDAAPALRRAAAHDPTNVYFRDHLGLAGHRVITDLVLEWMRSPSPGT